jgi:hypothetical protein
MKKLLLAICAAAVLAGGCNKGETIPSVSPVPLEEGAGDGDATTSVTFHFASEGPVAVSRAVDENDISNLQLLLIGTDGTRYYFESPAEKFLVAEIKRGVYDVYAAANGTSRLEGLDESALAALFAPYRQGDAVLAMSYRGKADFSAASPSAYSIALTRTVAKLRFSIKTPAGASVKSMSLHNVPDGAALFAGGPPPVTLTDVSLAPDGAAFTAYIPENLAGTVSSITDQRQRTRANAPAGASYLKITGELADRSHAEYYLYLGSNTTDDFNIRRNHDYRIEVNIAGDWSTDYRITAYRAEHPVEAPAGRYFDDTDVVNIVPSFSTSAPDVFPCVHYTYTFSGHTPGRLTINNEKRETFSGTLGNGNTNTLQIRYNPGTFTAANNTVKYTLVFRDTRGGVTEYAGELNYANRVSISVPTDGTTARADVIHPGSPLVRIANNPGSRVYIVHCPDNIIRLGITGVRDGYTFQGWYNNERNYEPENLISTSRFVDWDFMDKYPGFSVKVD